MHELDEGVISKDTAWLEERAGVTLAPRFAREVICNARLHPWLNGAYPEFGRHLDEAYIQSEGKVLHAIADYFEMLRPADVPLEPEWLPQLNQDGYVVLPNAFSADLIESLRAELMERPVHNTFTGGRMMYKDAVGESSDGLPLGNLRSTFADGPVSAQSKLVDILVSPLVHDAAQAYFGCNPYVNNSVVFVTHPNKTGAEGRAERSAYSQAWHYDLSQLKWLNFFIYLNDVDEENGAHQCVRGSHTRFVTPHRDTHYVAGTEGVYKPGVKYGRLSDEYVSEVYGDDAIATHTGSAGTMIVEDTRALHRALPVTKGRRDMIQVSAGISNLMTWKGESRFMFDGSLDERVRELRPDIRSGTLDSYMTAVDARFAGVHQSFEENAESFGQSRLKQLSASASGMAARLIPKLR